MLTLHLISADGATFDLHIPGPKPYVRISSVTAHTAHTSAPSVRISGAWGYSIVAQHVWDGTEWQPA